MIGDCIGDYSTSFGMLWVAKVILENQMETTIMENQMGKKMENEMETLGPLKGVYRDITPIMENQMEKKMESEMETGGM